MENKSKEQAARRLSIVFIAVVALILCGMVACIVLTPYDPGVLVGTSLSGNNQYGGTLSASNDYLFYAQNGKIMRLDYGTNETESIYNGAVSHLNPYDGWLYFVQDGKMMRIAYYGGTAMQLGSHTNVKSMSVNGLWIYYLTEDGRLHKIRSDGEKQSTLTDGSIDFKAFESANRIILATDGKAIYRMKTDGADCEVMVTGSDITRMVYTLDNLYYCDNGVVKEIRSVEAGQDDGTRYSDLPAEIFNYSIDGENRGVLYYVKGDQLRACKLQSVEHDKTEDVLLTKAADVADLYVIGEDLYYHDTKGNLFYVRINDAECTVEPVE